VSLLLWSRTCFRLDDQRSSSEQSAKAEEDPEELFEETAERQKERAADVERRLERLELLDSDVSETEIREPAPQIPDDRDELIQRNSKLEEEHALLTQIIEKQERVFAKQLKFLAQMQSLPWLQHVGKEAAVDIRSHLNSAFEDFQSEISEIEQLLERSRGVRMTVDDQRFYPSSDEDEPSDTPPVARRNAGH
jgi:plasmid stabilization system protein ParE